MNVSQKNKFTSTSLAFILVLVALVLLITTAISAQDDAGSDRQQHHLTSYELAAKLHAESEARLNECDGGTEASLGAIIGTGLGVPAYSNCNDKIVTMQDHTVIYDAHAKTFFELDDKVGQTLLTDPKFAGQAFEFSTGMKWQCVEYARRFLLSKYGLVFQDCGGAVDIWRMTFLVQPGDAAKMSDDPSSTVKRFAFDRYPNFANENDSNNNKNKNNKEEDENSRKIKQPTTGDVVIWPIQKDMPFGHVGILVDIVPTNSEGEPLADTSSSSSSDTKITNIIPVVDTTSADVQSEGKDTIVAIAKLAEQNFANAKWKNPDYARELHVYRRAKTNRLALKDPDGYKILGWLRARPDVAFHGAYSHVMDGLDLDVEGTNGLPKRVYATDANTFKSTEEYEIEKNEAVKFHETLLAQHMKNLERMNELKIPSDDANQEG